MLSAVKPFETPATWTYFKDVSAHQSTDVSFDSLVLRSFPCFDSHHFSLSQLQAQISIFFFSKMFPTLKVIAKIKEDTLRQTLLKKTQAEKWAL